MIENTHIIQKQSVEITFNDLDDGMGMQNHIAGVFYERLQPQMEALFDELFGKNYYASIDNLEIDCGLLDKKNWEQDFTQQAIRKLKEQLIQVNKKQINHREIEEANTIEAFLFFLENGFLPWNNRIDSIVQLEEKVIINQKLITKLKMLITQQPKIAERLVTQFSKKFIIEIIEEVAEDKKELNEIFAMTKELEAHQIDKYLTDVAILKAFASDKKNRKQQFIEYLLTKLEEYAELKSAIKNLAGNIKRKEKADPETNKKESSKQNKSTEVIYINNAGLVLLHPFLPTLFEHLKLTEENKWISTSSQNKAVLVLAFLATGSNKFEEFDLVLNKILCGIDVDEAVVTDQELDDEIKNECEVLLRNIIKHWRVLKNTSIDGLREGFIQRNGKLSKVTNGWLLQAQQKSIDVLLGHLPWGLGLIKLPWMNELLFTEWA